VRRNDYLNGGNLRAIEAKHAWQTAALDARTQN